MIHSASKRITLIFQNTLTSSDITSIGTISADDAMSQYNKNRFSRILKENEKLGLVWASVKDDETHESSVVTTANDERILKENEKLGLVWAGVNEIWQMDNLE